MFFGTNKVKKKHVREGKLDLVMDIVQFSWVMAMLYLELFFTYSVDVFGLTSLVTHVRSEAGFSPWAPKSWWWFRIFLGGIPRPKVLKLKQITQILLLLYEIGPWFLVIAIIIWNKLLLYCCRRDRWSWYTSVIWCIRKAPCEIWCLLWTWPPLLLLLLLAVCELFSLLDVFRMEKC